MSIERNKELVFRFFHELMNLGNTEIAQEIIGPDFQPQESGLGKGPQGMRDYVIQYHTGFPDLRFDLGDMIAEGNQVAVRWTMDGLHEGEFMGISPTAKAISLPGMGFFYVNGDKLSQGWIIYDHLALMKKLGAISLKEQIKE